MLRCKDLRPQHTLAVLQPSGHATRVFCNLQCRNGVMPWRAGPVSGVLACKGTLRKRSWPAMDASISCACSQPQLVSVETH